MNTTPKTIDEMQLYKFWNYAKIKDPCTFDQFKQRYLNNGYVIIRWETEGVIRHEKDARPNTSGLPAS